LPPHWRTLYELTKLSDEEGRALSAHKSRAYEGYARRTMERALAATRKRHAHRLANDSGTNSGMGSGIAFRNGEENKTGEVK
jgi:hypothetical protein